MDWEAVIGLEVHVQLNTKSKIFSGSSTQFGSEPNSQASAIDLGLPGVLPVLNKEVVKKALQFGLAIDAEINQHSIFARKNYFYPDLPKGYQISQFERPIVGKGSITINVDDQNKTIGITRAHLEEDAGKSLHEDFHGMTGIDLNRAGIPLLEIVSEPELSTPAEAVAYFKAIYEIVTYLGICDGNMAEGSLRCDANVSVRPVGQEAFGTRAEIKNINSFRFIEKAIAYEIERQINVIESGEKVVQETRLYDADKDETRSMRGKEEAFDYRYFPCPDLLPVEIDSDFLEALKAQQVELAQQKRERYMRDFGLSAYDAGILTSEKAIALYFEILVEQTGEAKICANWVMGELMAALNKHNLSIEDSPITATNLAKLIQRILDQTINNRGAKTVFASLWSGEEGEDVDAIIENKGLKQVSDSGAIEVMIDKILADNPDQVEQYLSGKDKVFGFFVGQVMKQSKGSANPAQVNQLLKAKLKR